MANVRLSLNGKIAADPQLRQAVARVRSEGDSIAVRVTWEADDAGAFAAEAVGEVDVIVAGGGDGTVGETFDVALSANPPPTLTFGIVPLGTANDFARTLGIPVGDPLSALRLAISGPVRRIGAGLLDNRHFFNMVYGGFGSRVTAETDIELKRRLGAMAYLLTGVARFAELTANSGHVRAEGFDWQGRFLAIAIGNGRQAGGGIRSVPMLSSTMASSI
jgi:lipid kinase YegS